MHQTPKCHDPKLDQEHNADRFQVVYLAKHPGYELGLVIPTTSATPPSGELAFVKLRFRNGNQEVTCGLELEVLEDFYESLSRLMEYLNLERQKSLKKPQRGAQS